MTTKTIVQLQAALVRVQEDIDAHESMIREFVIRRMREAIQYYASRDPIRSEDLFIANPDSPRGARFLKANRTRPMSSIERETLKRKKYKHKEGTKYPPKYALDTLTWSGRGHQPSWLKAQLASGRKITEFLIRPNGRDAS